MITVEARVSEIDVGKIDMINEHRDRWGSRNQGPPRLVIETDAGDMIYADASPEAVSILCAVWSAITFGDDPENEEDAVMLSELRRIMASRTT